MSFSDWEFLLDGDSQEFRQRATELGSYYFNIYGGVDHWLDCQNDDFRMTTLYCEGETDPKLIWQIGYELVSLYNGASILNNKNYKKASIFSLLNKGERVDRVSRINNIGLLGDPAFSQARINAEHANGMSCSIKYPLLHLATKEQDVYFILKYLDMEPTWTTYYKLMEAIEGFASVKSVQLNISNRKRKLFTNTANNFSLSGFNSRHGFKAVATKNYTRSMSLEDGYNFVASMAKHYIASVYKLTFQN